MTTVDNKTLAKSSKKYYCENCDYGTCKKFNFDTHYESIKHKNNVLTTIDNVFKEIISSKKYSCEKCKKTYNDRAGLWRHNKKCKEEQTIIKIVEEPDSQQPIIIADASNNLIMELLKQNQEFTP